MSSVPARVPVGLAPSAVNTPEKIVWLREPGAIVAPTYLRSPNYWKAVLTLVALRTQTGRGAAGTIRRDQKGLVAVHQVGRGVTTIGAPEVYSPIGCDSVSSWIIHSTTAPDAALSNVNVSTPIPFPVISPPPVHPCLR